MILLKAGIPRSGRPSLTAEKNFCPVSVDPPGPREMSRLAATGLGSTSWPWHRAQLTLYCLQPSYSDVLTFGPPPSPPAAAGGAVLGGVSCAASAGGVMGGVATSGRGSPAS